MIQLLRILYCFFLLLVFVPQKSKAGQAPDLRKWGYTWEEYDSSLFYRLQSIDNILSYADSIEGVGTRTTRVYSEVLAATVRKRFYHGYSYYTVQDNWIGWLAGILIWDHLHALVLPDDILKHPNAACSQQAIVLKECFRKIGIDYREVDLNGHFVLEGKVEGRWLLFDTNMEPHFPRGRKSLEELRQSGELAPAYKHVLSPQQIQKMFGHPVYRQVNAPFAPKATLFQQATGFLSFVLPLILPLAVLVYLLLRRKPQKAKEVDEVKFVVFERNVEEVTAG